MDSVQSPLWRLVTCLYTKHNVLHQNAPHPHNRINDKLSFTLRYLRPYHSCIVTVSDIMNGICIFRTLCDRLSLSSSYSPS